MFLKGEVIVCIKDFQVQFGNEIQQFRRGQTVTVRSVCHNGDEINIGLEELPQYAFPFDESFFKRDSELTDEEIIKWKFPASHP